MKVNKTRRNVFAGLALAAILGTTGCSAINPQATTFEYAPSDGTQTSVVNEADASQTVEFLNIAVIAQDAHDESGRLIGTLHNQSTEQQDVELQINQHSMDFSLAANEILSLEEEQITVDAVGTDPGELASGQATAFGVTNEFHVSVLPPTLEEYREIYPGQVDEDQIEHLYDFQGQFHRDE